MFMYSSYRCPISCAMTNPKRRPLSSHKTADSFASHALPIVDNPKSPQDEGE